VKAFGNRQNVSCQDAGLAPSMLNLMKTARFSLLGLGLVLHLWSAHGADNPAPPVFKIESPPSPVPVTTFSTPPAAHPAPPPAAAPQRSAADLARLAAPIALYPDPLISIILPAAVYPVEIVQAARFVKDTNNIPKLKDQPWDPNVRAVAEIPPVIQKMSDDLVWTVDLGQAFLEQQKDLMDAIQELRGKAQAAGTLKTTPQQIVIVTNAVVERTYEQQVVYVTNTVVQIEPASPQVIYVPQYNPTVVYAPPPAYVVDPVVPLLTFGVGIAVGAIIANNCDWHYGGIYVGGGGFAYWGGGGPRPPYYPPPPGFRPPPYYPPPGYRPPPPGYRPPGYPPPGARPPGYPGGGNPPVVRPPGGTPPPRPTTLPAMAPGTSPAASATVQRWQPDPNRLSKAGAISSPSTAQARGWASAAPSTWTGNTVARPTTAPSSSRPTAAADISHPSPGASPSFNRPATPAIGSRPSAGSGTAVSRPTAPSGSSSINRGSPPSVSSRDSAFGGMSSGQAARNSSSRGSFSRSGGGGSGGGRH
jgi:hypothetical protein